MAQAPLKKSASSKATKPKTTKSSTTPHTAFKAGITKKGSRTIAPKNVQLAKQQKMTKKFSGGLINETERMLAGKAGHLELLGGGKKKKGEPGKKGGNRAMESVKGKGRAKR